MDRILGTFEQGHVVFDVPAEWPDGARVEVSLVTSGLESDNGQGEPPTGVRTEFWSALNDENSWGFDLDDSYWPLTPEETRLLLNHMDTAEPLDMTPAEIERPATIARPQIARQVKTKPEQPGSRNPTRTHSNVCGRARHGSADEKISGHRGPGPDS